MKPLVAGLVAVALSLSASAAPCDDHLLSRDLIDLRVAEARQERRANAGAVRSFLADLGVPQAAFLARLSPDNIAAGLSDLSGQELRDLADRASRLNLPRFRGHLE